MHVNPHLLMHYRKVCVMFAIVNAKYIETIGSRHFKKLIVQEGKAILACILC